MYRLPDHPLVHFVQGGVELPHVKVMLHETIRNVDF